MNKRITKDELFLLKLFDIASRLGDPLAPVDRYKVGQAMGQNDKSIDNIVNLLAQTNFIKKGEEKTVYLTAYGLSALDRFRQ